MPTGVRDRAVRRAARPASPTTVRVVVGDVGGGFGMKTGAYPEDMVLALRRAQLQRPVKWRAERLEEFLAAVHGRDSVSHAELALDAQGQVLALRVRSLANIGAYAPAPAMVIPLLVGPWVTTSIYDIPAIDLHLSAVMTHTRRRPAPTAAPAGPRRSTSSSG